MEDFSLSHDQKVESPSITDMSFAELKEEAELDQVDFETFLEEIRAS